MLPAAAAAPGSWKKFEGRNVFGPNDCEVAPIQRRDRTDSESLGERHHGGINCPERKIMVSAYQLGNPHPVASSHGLDDEVSRGEIAQESHFRLPPQPRFDEIGDFGNDQLWHQQRTRMRFEKPQTCVVIAVVFVYVGVQRSGIDDQRDLRASSRMISSMRRAVSCVPLRPAFAASSFRRARPPRWISIASRVMSATVL
jgi:hypothetical protein